MSFYLEKQKKIWIGKFSKLSQFEKNFGFSHAITTRIGGTSCAPYDSLNMGLHVGDDPSKVIANRKIVCDALHLDFDSLCAAEQVHGSHVKKILRADAGRGRCDYSDAIPQTDALITNERDISLLLCVADCSPIFLFDKNQRAAAIIHAGWKGTLAKIVEKTLRKMMDEFGSNPKDIFAGIGPTIGTEPNCEGYEVSLDLVNKFTLNFQEDAEKFIQKDNGKFYLNLAKANILQLQKMGVPDENIDAANLCTLENSSWFFSHRSMHGQGQTGRFAAIVTLPSKK